MTRQLLGMCGNEQDQQVRSLFFSLLVFLFVILSSTWLGTQSRVASERCIAYREACDDVWCAWQALLQLEVTHDMHTAWQQARLVQGTPLARPWLTCGSYCCGS